EVFGELVHALAGIERDRLVPQPVDLAEEELRLRRIEVVHQALVLDRLVFCERGAERRFRGVGLAILQLAYASLNLGLESVARRQVRPRAEDAQNPDRFRVAPEMIEHLRHAKCRVERVSGAVWRVREYTEAGQRLFPVPVLLVREPGVVG